jgi:hypothetical protein
MQAAPDAAPDIEVSVGVVPSRRLPGGAAAAVGAGIALTVGIVAFAALRFVRTPSRDAAARAEPGAPTAPTPAEEPQPPTADSTAPAPAALESASAPVAAADPVGADAQAPKSGESAQLIIRCQPPCELVFVDNRKVDNVAPVTVTAGTHMIAAGRTGYPARTEKVTLSPGERHTAILSLLPQKPAIVKAPASKPCGKFLKRCD